jgi:hypothetical protein
MIVMRRPPYPVISRSNPKTGQVARKKNAWHFRSAWKDWKKIFATATAPNPRGLPPGPGGPLPVPHIVAATLEPATRLRGAPAYASPSTTLGLAPEDAPGLAPASSRAPWVPRQDAELLRAPMVLPTRRPGSPAPGRRTAQAASAAWRASGGARARGARSASATRRT